MALITQEEYDQHREDGDGFCSECDKWTVGGVEPDAAGYECENCGEEGVVGIETALIEGFITVEDP